jgi:hypothetical protein
MATRTRNFMEQLSDFLHPHTERISNAIIQAGHRIEQRVSHLGKPDTGDNFHHIIVKRKLSAALKELNMGQNETDPPGPTLGEIWLVRSIAVNGIPGKSPRFVIRTNTGRLIFAVVKEGMGIEIAGGDIVLTQGEVFMFEAEAEGEFDFTITINQRKLPRQIADAGYGTAQGDDINLLAHSGEHEPDRYIPDLPGGQAWVDWQADVPDVIVSKQQEQYGGHDVALPTADEGALEGEDSSVPQL